MRVLVFGGRDYKNYDEMLSVLSEFGSGTVVVHGGARGADLTAKKIALSLGFEQEPHPADWEGPCRAECKPGHRKTRFDGKEYCPAAGVYRNQEMAESKPELALGFPGGNGTADMRLRCIKEGIKLRVYE